MANIEKSGLDVVPIIVLLTFPVGAVIALLDATVLANFGTTICTVNLVVSSFLHELAMLFTATPMADRTVSAFAAQIGSIKVSEEIDTTRTLGLNPIELLVLPRVLTLLVSLPVLALVGTPCGIVGDMIICTWILDIPPAMFLLIMENGIGAQHFLVDISKAPPFAFLIAVIDHLEDFKVSDNAQPAGEYTTISVVHSIFVAILLDALAALSFMEMGW